MKSIAIRSLAAAVLVFLAVPVPAQVSVSDAWVRATVEGQTATGAYMRLTSRHSVTLVAVSSKIAGHAAVHEMQMHGDVMTMRPVDRLPIPAGQTITLDEGHYHVMLEALKEAVHAGDPVVIDLLFVDAKGARQAVRAVAVARPLGGP